MVDTELDRLYRRWVILHLPCTLHGGLWRRPLWIPTWASTACTTSDLDRYPRLFWSCGRSADPHPDRASPTPTPRQAIVPSAFASSAVQVRRWNQQPLAKRGCPGVQTGPLPNVVASSHSCDLR